MYMMRDPRGPKHLNRPNITWNYLDVDSWLPEYKAQIKGDIDPLDQNFFFKSGVFFLNDKDFKSCFSGFAQARDKSNEGYKNAWYDVD